ncbi:DeoR/GlpR family transcriptional regulator [Rathayibacter sp. VKM Ac-2856]|uniref:substrate-binding domain-containing protein n=1 Tax=unclassified Rathayibacter TaxID=2609250 RepID=UPI001564F1FC|nr:MULTISPECIES: substrate-binding domain-containing protein [unclassified Rathayibacter]NQX06022.1 DeoR/GlpR family transcriptional regulator [Rathayibacter sp. VKM Ac-2858]NQX21028.1 DeoR/GlpR family transcriptional regulator [Rathayibacter sp. VKM Ac-2856]
MSDQTQSPPLAAERRAHILAALGVDGAVRISQLTEALGVATVTLRRDLVQMEREGLLSRVHGGAVVLSGSAGATAAAAEPEKVELGSIAVLVPSLNYYWPGVLHGMEATGRSLGYDVVLRGASYELQDERPVLERLLRSGDVRGLIVAPNTDTEHSGDVLRWLADCGVPSVLVERDAVLEPEGTPAESVTTDHALGAVLAARHLAELGHRKVGLILSRNSPTSRKITAGWLSACEALGLTPADHFEETLPDRASADFSEVVNAALETALETGVTALLVHSDPEAMAFVDLALNRGISVPGDLSVIAYDDEVAQLFTPALTAVSPPRAGVGEAAVRLLVQRIEDPERPVHRVQLNPSLIVRASTAAPGRPETGRSDAGRPERGER